MIANMVNTNKDTERQILNKKPTRKKICYDIMELLTVVITCNETDTFFDIKDVFMSEWVPEGQTIKQNTTAKS